MRTSAASGVVLAALLTGCSGSADEESGATSARPSAESSSPAPASTTTAPPRQADVPEPPAATDDRKGRVAFARYVLQAWIYALNTNDPQPLLDLGGDRPCTGCRQLAAELEKRAQEGWFVALQDVRVSGVEVTTERSRTRAQLSAAIPESSTLHDDGTFRSSNPAHPRSTFEVTMERAGPRFRLVGFAVY